MKGRDTVEGKENLGSGSLLFHLKRAWAFLTTPSPPLRTSAKLSVTLFYLSSELETLVER